MNYKKKMEQKHNSSDNKMSNIYKIKMYLFFMYIMSMLLTTQCNGIQYFLLHLKLQNNIHNTINYTWIVCLTLPLNIYSLSLSNKEIKRSKKKEYTSTLWSWYYGLYTVVYTLAQVHINKRFKLVDEIHTSFITYLTWPFVSQIETHF